METRTLSLEIAKTIIEQIKYADKWFLMVIGANNFIALPESKEFQGGVRFKVNGHVHKGIIMIELRWADDYTVSFINRKGEVVKLVEGVYCDMLVDILNWVEYV